MQMRADNKTHRVPDRLHPASVHFGILPSPAYEYYSLSKVVGELRFHLASEQQYVRTA